MDGFNAFGVAGAGAAGADGIRAEGLLFAAHAGKPRVFFGAKAAVGEPNFEIAGVFHTAIQSAKVWLNALASLVLRLVPPALPEVDPKVKTDLMVV
jgi:hypothetical protein